MNYDYGWSINEDKWNTRLTPDGPKTRIKITSLQVLIVPITFNISNQWNSSLQVGNITIKLCSLFCFVQLTVTSSQSRAYLYIKKSSHAVAVQDIQIGSDRVPAPLKGSPFKKVVWHGAGVPSTGVPPSRDRLSSGESRLRHLHLRNRRDSANTWNWNCCWITLRKFDRISLNLLFLECIDCMVVFCRWIKNGVVFGSYQWTCFLVPTMSRGADANADELC